MLKIELHNRIIENKDWATLLFVLCFIFILISKSAFENKFHDFKNLWFSERYVKMYRDKSHLMTWFTFLMFVVQVFSFGFFIHYLLYYFDFIKKTDGVVFIQIIILLFVFILAKYLIEKIIATAFDVEEIIEQHNMLKVSYRNYIAMIVLPITTIMYYNTPPKPFVLWIIIGIVIAINLLIYTKGFKIFQKIIIGKLFYFILYLCTLEIAPYFFLYYYVTKR
jgi:hypothetical protein